MRRFALLAALVLSACNQQQPQPAANQPYDNELPGAVAGSPVTNTPATNEPTAPPPSPGQPPVRTPSDDFHKALRLTGTEPFWGVRIGDKITLSRPDHADVVVANAGPTINGDVAVWNSPQLTVRLERGVCSDGMSDNRYPYKATVLVDGGETLRGCAAPADQWPKPGGA